MQRKCLGLLACLPLLGITSAIHAGGQPIHPYERSELRIPIADDHAEVWAMKGHLCMPSGVAQAHLVIINHGSPPSPAERKTMRLAGCESEAAQWFLSRGYAVALLERLGYGETGGPWAEGYDRCDDVDYYSLGIETARQIGVMVDYLTSLPHIAPNGVVLVGQSAGGWGTLAYGSLPGSRVSAVIDMAGGRGGHFHGGPNQNCHPERLVEAAGRFGKSSSIPTLWIFASNDSYFDPVLAKQMHDAFVESGGKADFIMKDSFGDDGHHLFFGKGGSAIWGPDVGAFLNRLASPPPP